MSICADHGPVKTEILRLKGRHRHKLCGKQILLHNVVLFKQYLEDIEFDALGHLIVQKRAAADEDVERFARDRFTKITFILFFGKVWKQVGDAENRVGFTFADFDVDLGSVLFYDHAVQCERNGRPLIFFYAAVVVRLHQAQFRILINRSGFQVEPRAVNMRGGNIDAISQGTLANDGEYERTVAVVKINFRTRRIFFPILKRDKSAFLQHFNRNGNAFPFRFAAIHKRLVVFRVFHARRNRLVVYARIRVLGCIKQFFLELFAVCLHDEPPM